MLANAAMVAVMVMTPLEMHHQGAAHTAIGAALSAHFLGMYAFAPCPAPCPTEPECQRHWSWEGPCCCSHSWC